VKEIETTMKIAESLILESPEQEAQMYADLFPEIHPNIKVEEQKIKQAWLDGYNNQIKYKNKLITD
jgi:hypothetical protein